MMSTNPLCCCAVARFLRVGALACALAAFGFPATVCAAEENPQEIDELSVPDNLIQLDGSASSDNDGDKLSYNWRQVDGPRVQLLNATTAKPSFYARQPGKYSFELIVSDGKARSKPAIVSIEVDKLNHAPQLQLVKLVQARPGVPFTLDASGTRDEDGDPVRYVWKQISGPAALTKGGSSQQPTLSLQAQEEGTYVFEVVATDGTARSAPERCEVQVIHENTAPVAKVTAPNSKVLLRPAANSAATSGATGATDGSNNMQNTRSARTPALDQVAVPALDPLEEAMTQSPDNSLKETYLPQAKPSASGARVRGTPAADAPASGRENAPRASAQTEEPSGDETLANSRPQTGNSGNNKGLTASIAQSEVQAEVGERVVIRGYGGSPEGKHLTFNWKQVTTQRLGRDTIKGKNLEFTPTEDGMYIFELTVSDGTNYSKPALVRVRVAGTNENVMGLAGDAGKVNDVDVPGIAPVPAAENRGLFSRVLNKVK